MDNTIAIGYINKLGGTVSPELNCLTKDLWLWCLDRNIIVQATHLAGVFSLCQCRLEALHRRFCPDQPTVWTTTNGPIWFQVDTLIPQLCELAPRPRCNAFAQDWSQFKGAYANRPRNLIGKILSLVYGQHAQLVLIAPVLVYRPWYPLLLEMVMESPACLPSKRNLIQPTHSVNQVDTNPQLAAWVISARSSEAKRFWNTLQDSSYPIGYPNHLRLMTRCSRSGPASVVKGVLFPF